MSTGARSFLAVLIVVSDPAVSRVRRIVLQQPT